MERVHFQRISSDNPIIASGTPVVIYGYNIASIDTTVSSLVSLYDGTSTGGTLVIRDYLPDISTSDTNSKTVTFPSGVMFASGCYVDLTALSNCVIFYSKA